MLAGSLPTRPVGLDRDAFPKAASEWMELEDLSSEIGQSNARLQAARSAGSHAVAQLIQKEVAQLEERRDKLLANIAKSFIEEQPEPSENRPSADRRRSAEENSEVQVDRDATAAAGEPAGGTRESENDADPWTQLTPGDIERAKRELTQRRIEILARHAAELRALDADQGDIAGLERAIEIFTRKFCVQDTSPTVVRREPAMAVVSVQ